jgi:hypothetical protein
MERMPARVRLFIWTMLGGTMVDLIRLMQRWLWPAATETQTEAQDTSSMADLVRLLGTERESPGQIDGQGGGQANEADHS